MISSRPIVLRGFIDKNDQVHVFYHRRQYHLESAELRHLEFVNVMPVDPIEMPGEIIVFFREPIDEMRNIKIFKAIAS